MSWPAATVLIVTALAVAVDLTYVGVGVLY